MHILFLSTHNLATNPRLVKEIDLALENRFGVTVICCGFDNWSKANNELIKQRLAPKVKYIEVPATRNPFLPWLMSSVMHSSARLLLGSFKNNTRLLSWASNKRSWLLFAELQKLKPVADLVIAHNPGSFYPAAWYAKNNNIPLGIDLEDYHPGETTNKKEIAWFKSLNKNILPQADYISAASPLILTDSNADLNTTLQHEVLVLNYFPGTEFLPPEPGTGDRVKLVWFSQNIARGRGLEELLDVLHGSKDFELHLYGNPDKLFAAKFLQDNTFIILHPALPQVSLHQELRKYDVGLAIERPASNLNRDLCLTNKILAYQQAGLFILASDTQAQKQFLTMHPNLGLITSLDITGLKRSLSILLQWKKTNRKDAATRYAAASAFTWENESQKLLNSWKQVMS